MGPATSAPLWSPSSLSVTRDGSILTGTSDSVRLVPHALSAAPVLAVAIRPLLGSASARGYRLRYVLTEPARLTVRLYRPESRRPILTATAFSPAGESTLNVRRRAPLPPGVYAVDLRANAGTQSTRTSQWVYLGGRLTGRFIRSLQSAEALFYVLPHAKAIAAGPISEPWRCHQFNSPRVDCEWGVGRAECDGIEASFLTVEGLIYERGYGCPTPRRPGLFKPNPGIPHSFYTLPTRARELGGPQHGLALTTRPAIPKIRTGAAPFTSWHTTATQRRCGRRLATPRTARASTRSESPDSISPPNPGPDGTPPVHRPCRAGPSERAVGTRDQDATRR